MQATDIYGKVLTTHTDIVKSYVCPSKPIIIKHDYIKDLKVKLNRAERRKFK